MKPHVTEKSFQLAAGEKPVFTLAVSAGTTASELRDYLKRAYHVEMVDVRFLTIAREATRRKGVKGFRSGIRKALVTLKKGQRLPEFEATTPTEEKKDKQPQEK